MFFCGFVFDKFDADHQAFAPNMPNARMTRLHFGEDVDFVSARTPRVSPAGDRDWRRWYAFGVKLALRALADLSDRRYFWLGSLLLEVQALALAGHGIRKAYVFRLFDRRPYLLATYLAQRTSVQTVCVFQNIPLWRRIGLDGNVRERAA